MPRAYFKNEVGVPIRQVTGIDLTSTPTTKTIKLVKPDATSTTWTGTDVSILVADIGYWEVLTKSGQLDQVGEYLIQACFEWTTGSLKKYGPIMTIQVDNVL